MLLRWVVDHDSFRWLTPAIFVCAMRGACTIAHGMNAARRLSMHTALPAHHTEMFDPSKKTEGATAVPVLDASPTNPKRVPDWVRTPHARAPVPAAGLLSLVRQRRSSSVGRGGSALCAECIACW